MKDDCAVGVFDTVEAAEIAIHILHQGGLESNQISVLTKYIDSTSEVAQELNLEDDSLRDALLGGTLGGIIGILGDVMLYAITGFGTVLVVGPLAASAGAVVGGILGAMEGWGIHKTHLDKYQALLHAGKVVVVVQGAPGQVDEAEVMLRQTEAMEVHHYSASSDSFPEITRHV